MLDDQSEAPMRCCFVRSCAEFHTANVEALPSLIPLSARYYHHGPRDITHEAIEPLRVMTGICTLLTSSVCATSTDNPLLPTAQDPPENCLVSTQSSMILSIAATIPLMVSRAVET